jgi:hypothetical protein
MKFYKPRQPSLPEKAVPSPAEVEIVLSTCERGSVASFEHELVVELPPGTKLSFAPDWGYFIQNSDNRERLSFFRPTAEDALIYFIEQGREKVY